jgi:hypothetical protein
MFSMNFDENELNILPLSYSLCRYPQRPWQSNNFGRKFTPIIFCSNFFSFKPSFYFLFFRFFNVAQVRPRETSKKETIPKKLKKQVKTILKILGPTETKRRRKNYRYYCSLDSAAAAMWMFVVYGLTSISMLVIDNKFPSAVSMLCRGWFMWDVDALSATIWLSGMWILIDDYRPCQCFYFDAFMCDVDVYRRWLSSVSMLVVDVDHEK